MWECGFLLALWAWGAGDLFWNCEVLAHRDFIVLAVMMPSDNLLLLLLLFSKIQEMTYQKSGTEVRNAKIHIVCASGVQFLGFICVMSQATGFGFATVYYFTAGFLFYLAHMMDLFFVGVLLDCCLNDRRKWMLRIELVKDCSQKNAVSGPRQL